MGSVKLILKNGPNNLVSGDISAGQILELVFDSTFDAFQVVGSSGGGSGIIPMGTSGFGATPIGTANIQVGAVGTPANTSETLLFGYSRPGNALITDGQGVRIWSWFLFNAPMRSRTFKMYFGSTVIGQFTS